MHNIYYITCGENENKRNIMADIQEHAEQEGDGYSSRFTWHDEIPPYENYDKAKEAIKMLDRGFYDDHAVKFYDYSNANKTAKIKEYETKIQELARNERKYKEEHSIHLLKAKHIGCERCGSKLNKDYIVGERCPLCSKDLRSKTTIEKMEWFNKKRKEYNARIEDEKMKQKSKAKIKWLIKYEFHS